MGHSSSCLCVKVFDQDAMIEKEFQQTARSLKMCKHLFMRGFSSERKKNELACDRLSLLVKTGHPF